MVRFKNRYIVCEINSPQSSKAVSLDNTGLFRWISALIEKIHGEFGAAATRAGLSVKYLNPDTKIGIIRVRHGPHKLLASALSFASNLQDGTLLVRTLYVGASLSCCYKFLQKHQRYQLDKLWDKLGSADRLKLEKALKDPSVFKSMQGSR